MAPQAQIHAKFPVPAFSRAQKTTRCAGHFRDRNFPSLLVMSAAPTTCVYSPLDASRNEIRLIEVLSIKPLTCSISTVSLDDRPSFSALSYEWGDANRNEAIAVHGQDLAIPTNLARALDHAVPHWQSQFPDRSPGSCRLWADAICIHQADSEEKRQQIPLMREIYQTAEIVICWLGPHDEILERALMTIARLGRPPAPPVPETLEELMQTSFKGPSAFVPGWIDRCPDIFQDEEGRDWDSILALVHATYWRRVWILQERTLAQRAILACGEVSASMRDFSAVASWGKIARFRGKPATIGPYVWDVITRYCPWETITDTTKSKPRKKHTDGDEPHPTMHRPMQRDWKLSAIGALLKAKDPRDHLYGLLGLTNLDIEPDYSVSVCHLYRRYFTLWLEAHSVAAVDQSSETEAKLDPLFLLRFSGIQSFPDMPTWVPNFPLALPGIHENTLIVPAVRLETISTRGLQLNFSHPYPQSDRSMRLALYLRNIILVESQTPVPSFSRFLDAVVVLHCLSGYNPAGVREAPQVAIVLRFIAWQMVVLQHSQGIPTRSFVSLIGMEKVWTFAGLPFDFEYEFLADGSTAFECHFVNGDVRLAETESGRIGMCPSAVMTGDILCVLRGSGLPSILRRVRDHYLHIGTCFFSGIMNGEVAELVKSNKVSIETVEIW
ncbi:heterokaryon incompatibility protein-domain-containing protein [Podospora aff. communis PSN243]|uniref:Heterokaryon incompatibility protein-domain-containing protein n=1 Tax=Podospora aff. communis PSN243 TaxID=3040156 RepID=A0AAV9GMK9_9PEZI|nr:heterokaryon incompatibility protein-domain-containing protein [Podospora aff. communis PSN243]